MLVRLLTVVCVGGILSGVFCVALALCEDATGDASGTPSGDPTPAPAADDHRVSVAVARERAELMHRIYAATLDVMHDRSISTIIVPWCRRGQWKTCSPRWNDNRGWKRGGFR
ncbi:MAG TPA: hypothetical protein VNH11_26190 [Pirellulales bacterium]|nr:hypothetical protein [Pirellulales bacterium]